MIVFVTAVKPFENPVLNRMELFNECCIIVAAYHLFYFTDYLPDYKLQYKLGWSLIGVTIFNITVNMGLMVWTSVR